MKRIAGITNWLMRGKKAKVYITFENGDKALFYKGCVGSVKLDEDGWYYGKLLNYKGEIIKDLVLYEGETIKALEEDFKEAVRQYRYFIRKERKQKCRE